MSYIYLILAFSLNAFANILLKIGSAKGFDLSSYNPISIIVKNSYFVFGCTLFALNSVFYFLALKSMPISVAYPVMVIMSFVIINAFAFLVLKESVSFNQIVGYGFIVIGLWLIVSNR